MDDLRIWLDQFAFIAGIGIGACLAVLAACYLADAARRAFGRSSEEKTPITIDIDDFWRGCNGFMEVITGLASAEENTKRKNDDEAEQEKPKRHEYVLGDDGELIEVIHDAPQTLDALIQQYDRMEDEERRESTS